MELKVGDKVRIRSKEWINAQEKPTEGWIDSSPFGGWHFFVKEMFQFAGEEANIIAEYNGMFTLDIDGGDWTWEKWMFEPQETAIKAMKDMARELYQKEDVANLMKSWAAECCRAQFTSFGQIEESVDNWIKNNI